MAMEREAWPGESEEQGPAEAEGEDPGKWYFDLPGGAWERQEAKNRNLRQSVLENMEGESRRRTFPGTEPEPEEQRGRFGRRKKQHEAPSRGTPGGTYQLRKGGVDAEAWKHPQDPGGWDQDEDDTEDDWRRQPRGRDVPQDQHRAEQPKGRKRPEDDEVPGRENVPLVLHRRRPAETEAQPEGGRWNDAFGSSKGAWDEPDGALSAGSGWGEPPAGGEQRPRRRRILPDVAPETHAEHERPRDEAPPAVEKPRMRRPRDEAPPAVENPLEEWPRDEAPPAVEKPRIQRPRDEAPPAVEKPRAEWPQVEPAKAWQEPEEPEHAGREEPLDEAPPREEEKPKSRWDEMFGAPADDGGFLDGMRKWSEQSRAKSRPAWGGEERPRSERRVLDSKEPEGRTRDEGGDAPAPARRRVEHEDESPHDRKVEPEQPPKAHREEKFSPPPEAPPQRREPRMPPIETRAWEAGVRAPREVDRERPVPARWEEKFGTPERVARDFDQDERGVGRSERRWEDEEDDLPPARTPRGRGEAHREEPVEYRAAEQRQPAPDVEQQEAPVVKQNPWSASKWGPDDYEEPEIDEDLDLFRPGAERREPEPPEKERKGGGLARIFGRRKQPAEEPPVRPEPSQPEFREAWQERRTPRRPIWDERDWGTVEQRRSDEPPPWFKDAEDEEDEPDAAFLQQELERSRQSRRQEEPDESEWDEREERFEARMHHEASGWTDQGEPRARRSFTAPDGAVDEPRWRDDMPRRTESVERYGAAEPASGDEGRRGRDRASHEAGESHWTPPRFSYEADEEPAPRPHRGQWQPEPVEYVDEPPRRTARFEETDDEDDPWAGFLAGRGDSPRPQRERYAQPADADEMTGGREEPRWSE